MLPLPTPTRSLARRLIAAGLLLWTGLAGMAEIHAAHGVAPRLQEALAGTLLQPSACHPHQAIHLEAAGNPHHTHSCAACLHLQRAVGLARAPLPRLPLPGRALPSAPPAVAAPASEPLTFADPRAPPALPA